MKRKRRHIWYLNFVVPFFLITANSCAQQKTIITKYYSSYVEKLPGNIPVDKNGEELSLRADTAITVYLETTTKSLKWDAAWLNGKNYLIIVKNISQQTVQVGVKKINGERIVLLPAKNHFIWQLYLQPLLPLKTAPVRVNKNEVLLKGKYKTKVFYQKAGVVVQLEGIPAV